MRGRWALFLSPKWIAFHLVVIIAAATLFNLGLWQLRRLDERQSFNAVVEQRFSEPAVALDVLIPDDVVIDSDGADVLAAGIEWRSATVSGTYLPEHAIRVVNRSQNGRAGDNLVVPLRLDDTRVLLVSRGFVPLGVEAPDVPSVTVEVTGRLHPSQERSFSEHETHQKECLPKCNGSICCAWILKFRVAFCRCTWTYSLQTPRRCQGSQNR